MQRSIQLLSGAGKLVTGLLCDMSDRHLEDFETIGKGMLSAADQPDRYWLWDYKLRQADRDTRYETYAIEGNSLTQELML